MLSDKKGLTASASVLTMGFVVCLILTIALLSTGNMQKQARKHIGTMQSFYAADVAFLHIQKELERDFDYVPPSSINAGKPIPVTYHSLPTTPGSVAVYGAAKKEPITIVFDVLSETNVVLELSGDGQLNTPSGQTLELNNLTVINDIDIFNPDYPSTGYGYGTYILTLDPASEIKISLSEIVPRLLQVEIMGIAHNYLVYEGAARNTVSVVPDGQL